MSVQASSKSTNDPADTVAAVIVAALFSWVSLLITATLVENRFFPNEQPWYSDSRLADFFEVPHGSGLMPSSGALWLALVVLSSFYYWLFTRSMSCNMKYVVTAVALSLFVSVPGAFLAAEFDSPSRGGELQNQMEQRLREERLAEINSGLAPGVILTKRLSGFDGGPLLCVESAVPLSSIFRSEWMRLDGRPILENGKPTGLHVYRALYIIHSEPKEYCPDYKPGRTWIVQYYMP
jgi:hypothetical protein